METNSVLGAIKSIATNNQPSEPKIEEIAGCGECPACGTRVNYTRKDKSVECPSCNNVYDVSQLLPIGTQARTSGEAQSTAALAAEFAMSIDSPDSALVYLENFFNDFNWDNYKRTTSLSIYEISGMVEKNKIKYGASANAWRLDFESKILPLTKKLEGLAEQEAEFLEEYNGVDSTALFPKYDTYQRITAALKDASEKLFAALENDIQYAAKFGATEAVLSSMKARLDKAKALYKANVHEFSSFGEVPAIKKAREKLKAKVAEKLKAEGIDAQATYKEAVELYESSEDKSEALKLFQSIREYDDSQDYIAKINRYFNFQQRLLKLANKHFLFKKVAAQPAAFTLNQNANKDPLKGTPAETPAAPAQSAAAPQESSKPTYALYEVTDGTVAEKAAVSGISYILRYYGNKLFFVKKDRAIASYDVVSHTETELIAGKPGDFLRSKAYLSQDGSSFYVRKKLAQAPKVEEKTGCLASIKALFKKPEPVFTDDKNNFAVIKVDMANNTATTAIDKIVDITECYNDRMFYLTYLEITEGTRHRLKAMPSFMVCDFKTGENREVLSDECQIHNVIGDNIIYSTWDPNELNKMLYSYDMKSEEKTLIEANVFNYFTTIEDRVYYTVGNKSFAPLFSNNMQGTDRLEITRNVKEIHSVSGGWMYLIKGSGRNTSLFKMSTDGKEFIHVCSDLKSIIARNDAYTYYIDGANALRVVRNDGKENKYIASGITKDNVIIGNNVIYYLRPEAVSADKNAYSLYKMDIDGSNIKKLIFNVNNMQNYDENTIYIYKIAEVNYLATKTENDVVLETSRVTHNVTKFYTFDKNTETEELILTLGLPTDKSSVEKGGCFKKDLNHKTTYKEIPAKVTYKRAGLASAGSVYTEQNSSQE